MYRKASVTRGVIVLGEGGLEALAAPYDRKVLLHHSLLAGMKGATGTYLDMLPLLAGQGYSVFIPEMAMWRAAQALATRGGKLAVTGDFAQTAGGPSPAQMAIGTFCMRAAQCVYPGVVLQRPEASYEADGYANYLATLHELANSAMSGKAIRKPPLPDASREEAFLQRHCADIAAKHAVWQGQREYSQPLFVLSTGRDAPEGALSLTPRDLLRAMGNERTTADGYNSFTAAGLTGSGESHWKLMPDLPKAAGCTAFAESAHGLAEHIAQSRHWGDAVKQNQNRAWQMGFERQLKKYRPREV